MNANFYGIVEILRQYPDFPNADHRYLSPYHLKSEMEGHLFGCPQVPQQENGYAVLKKDGIARKKEHLHVNMKAF
ncbi:hypothetical protein GCM10010918_29350 [Paenibacillus radicis (ex Gao et al. 2016)]|uniref:Uncharacterized protein n=1 Tax=Paenibacillus radicis (ex Gao et al. 2016) TaxID=1737354 RepID=A0A917H9P9_9BACL|nr:hypothetical protein GCM10010918_29350 [Paenibacillus radicis (ex Gao et al. 2016)]